MLTKDELERLKSMLHKRCAPTYLSIANAALDAGDDFDWMYDLVYRLDAECKSLRNCANCRYLLDDVDPCHACDYSLSNWEKEDADED